MPLVIDTSPTSIRAATIHSAAERPGMPEGLAFRWSSCSQHWTRTPAGVNLGVGGTGNNSRATSAPGRTRAATSPSASVDRPRPVAPAGKGRTWRLGTRPRSNGLREWHRALYGDDSWNRERGRPHDIPARILGGDSGLGTGGTGMREEAVERWRPLGWSAPPAGAPSRSPAPGSGRGVVARHRSRLWSALTVPYALARVLLAVLDSQRAIPAMPLATAGST